MFKDEPGVLDKIGDGTVGFVDCEENDELGLLVVVENAIVDDDNDFEQKFVEEEEREVEMELEPKRQLTDNEGSKDGPPCSYKSDCGASKSFGVSLFGSPAEKNFTNLLTFDFLFVQVGVVASVGSLVGIGEESCLRSFSIAVRACKVI